MYQQHKYHFKWFSRRKQLIWPRGLGVMPKEKKIKTYMCTSVKVWILQKGTLKGVISVQKQSCVKIGKCMTLKKHTYPRKLEEENHGCEDVTVCFEWLWRADFKWHDRYLYLIWKQNAWESFLFYAGLWHV